MECLKLGDNVQDRKIFGLKRYVRDILRKRYFEIVRCSRKRDVQERDILRTRYVQDLERLTIEIYESI